MSHQWSNTYTDFRQCSNCRAIQLGKLFIDSKGASSQVEGSCPAKYGQPLKMPELGPISDRPLNHKYESEKV